MGDDIFVTNPEIIKGNKRKSGQLCFDKSQSNRHGERNGGSGKNSPICRWRTVILIAAEKRKTLLSPIFAVGLGASQIKTGSLSRADRVAKYNQLMRIKKNARQKQSKKSISLIFKNLKSYAYFAPAK